MKLKIYLFLIIVLITNSFCKEKKADSSSIVNKEKKTNESFPDIPLSKDWIKINFLYGQPGESMSDLYDKQIKQSMSYYEKKDYKNAKIILEEPIKKESNNLYILYYYARASYQIDKETSYKSYIKLIKSLDSIYNDTSFNVTIKMWFREAYWKLGTLYMDNKKWNEAKYEISRYLLSIQGLEKEYSYSQALEYLTECYFNLYDDKLAVYMATQTLKRDPNNTYVKEILEKIKTNK